MAPLNANLPPIFETPSVPLTYPATEKPDDHRKAQRPHFHPSRLLSFLVVLLVVIIQLVKPPPVVYNHRLDLYSPLSSASTCENTGVFHKHLPTSEPRAMSVLEEAEKVAGEFEYPAEDVRKGVKAFISQMSLSSSSSCHSHRVRLTVCRGGFRELRHDSEPDTDVRHSSAQWYREGEHYVWKWVEHVHWLKDLQGLYLAVDLGGTNFRVCSIQLNGDTTFNLTQSKVAIPRELMVAKTATELFSFLAKQVESFLRTHHNDHFEAHLERRKAGEQTKEEEIFQLGFTFSFPINQIGINRGTLMRWTKGFDIEEAVGRDVCQLLQKEIDALYLPVKVAALVNDTVGTLMARSYTSPGKTGTLLGAIFGTGTNGAYVEKLSKIKKLSSIKESTYDTSTGDMIINTEWGSFDNHLSVLPNTPYDQSLDAESVNPGIQMFEKRISGMFLGEILRRALLSLQQNPKIQLFKDTSSATNDAHSTTTVAEDSKLFQQWGIDTSFLSTAEADTTHGLVLTKQALTNDLGVDAASTEDAQAVKALVHAIGKRSARLSAVAIAAIVISTGHHVPRGGANPEDDVVDVGVDGSLVEYYPGFEDEIRGALREVPEIGERGEKRIRIGIAKDGSGVGAALIALVAGKKAET